MPRGAPIGTGNDNPPFRFYGRRKGRKLRPRRQHLVDEVLPQLRIDLQDAATPDRLFDFAPAEIWLEIGFGGGEHLAWQARANPEIGLIGAEPYINGIATLLARLEDDPAANIRIWPEDARPLLTALPQASLARVFILHPDPWPKTRHAARRIVGPETLELLAAAMADGASLRIATDDPEYVDWVLFHTASHPAFAWTATSPRDWRERPADWPVTRYETKTVGQGRPPTYLRFRRRPR